MGPWPQSDGAYTGSPFCPLVAAGALRKADTVAIQAVLLDLDGTLIDSNDAHAKAWVSALSEYDIVAPFGRVRRLIGKGGDKLLPELTGIQADSPLGELISRRCTAIFEEQFLPSVRAFPHSRELLQQLHADGFRLVVATSAQGGLLTRLIDAAGATGLLHAAASSDDVERSKPDPDLIQAALQKAGCQPSEALMLGDTPYDVTAAGRTGVATVALRCGGWHDHELQGAVAIYDDPQDLLESYEESPFGG